MKAKNLWYAGSNTDWTVMESESGEFVRFLLMPYRRVGERDLIPTPGFTWKGKNKLKVPEIYWGFYGIEKIDV